MNYAKLSKRLDALTGAVARAGAIDLADQRAIAAEMERVRVGHGSAGVMVSSGNPVVDLYGGRA
jgi:hypothetical protein